MIYQRVITTGFGSIRGLLLQGSYSLMIYQRVITTGVLTYDLQRVITTGFVLTFQNEIVGDLRRRMNPDGYYRSITVRFGPFRLLEGTIFNLLFVSVSTKIVLRIQLEFDTSQNCFKSLSMLYFVEKDNQNLSYK